MGKRNVGPLARSKIKEFEGCSLTAYPDPATKGEPYTIGYGFTMPGRIKPGDKIPQWAADALFDLTIDRFAQHVDELLGASDTDAAQFGALVSFAYNVGLSNLASSTLLKKHKAKDWAGAAAEFARWNKANGKEMAGLTKRRKEEAALYRLYR